ncbi:MAG: hypothetical protein QXY07_02670 [Candidatus Bathyarchaeia archaeon]
MHYRTRVSLKNADQKTVEQALKWCTLCQSRDETFKFYRKGNFIIIESPTKTQAFKRGSALHKKFQLHYNVEKPRA